MKLPVLDAEKASRTLRRGLVSLVILVVLAVGLILAVPGLHGVGRTLAHMPLGWIAAAIALEILSCLGYVLAFLQVFETAPVRFGGRVALSELAFGTAVSLGGAGSVAVGAWLLIERGARPARVAERSAVLFLLTSAVNVITMTVVGLALFLGILPGPRNPLLSAVPAGVGIAILAFFLGRSRACPSSPPPTARPDGSRRCSRRRPRASATPDTSCSNPTGGSSARSPTCGATSPCSRCASPRRATPVAGSDRARLPDRLPI